MWPADLADRAIELYLACESAPAYGAGNFVAAALGAPLSRLYLVRFAHRMLREIKLSDGSAVLRSSHEARRLAEQRRREKRQEGV